MMTHGNLALLVFTTTDYEICSSIHFLIKRMNVGAWKIHRIQPLKNLLHAVKINRRGMHSGGVILFHNNAKTHSASESEQLKKTFGWKQMNQPPYSSDLAPSDFNLYFRLKLFFNSSRFENNEKVKHTITF